MFKMLIPKELTAVNINTDLFLLFRYIGAEVY